MQTIFPFLRYSDAAAAIAWLVEAFGGISLRETPRPR